MANSKVQAFASKLKLFQESCTRLASATGNIPSSGDFIGLLKYFQTTLHSFAKEIQDLEMRRFETRQNDYEWRSRHLPQAEYGSLYLCILNLSESVEKLANQSTVCEHILRTLHSLIIFLDLDCMEGLPVALAWMLVYFPVNIHTSIIELMCSVVIPLVYMSLVLTSAFVSFGAHY